MSSVGAQKVMMSALEQWDVVERLTEAAQEVLPKDECVVLDRTARKGASRSLVSIDRRTRESTPNAVQVERRKASRPRRDGTRISSAVKEIQHELEKRASSKP